MPRGHAASGGGPCRRRQALHAALPHAVDDAKAPSRSGPAIEGLTRREHTARMETGVETRHNIPMSARLRLVPVLALTVAACSSSSSSGGGSRDGGGTGDGGTSQEAGCPADLPATGAACSPEGAECGYATETNPCGAANCYCMQGAWGCNPTCAILDGGAGLDATVSSDAGGD